MYFRACGKLRRPIFKSRLDSHLTEVTNRGLRLELPLTPLRGDVSKTIFLGILHCTSYTGSFGWGTFYAIILQRLSNLEEQYTRIAPDLLVEMNSDSYGIALDRFTHVCLEDTEWKRSLFNITGDTGYFMTSEDHVPQLMFVRSTPKEFESIAGFYVYPEAISKVPMEGSVKIVVPKYQSPWDEWGSRYGSKIII
jgi:hypothetical protein